MYYKLLKQGQEINTNIYCNQLDKLNAVFQENRPVIVKNKGIIFHDGNATLHTIMVTQQNLNELGWKVLSHLPYSPEITPSNFYLLRLHQNYLTIKSRCSYQLLNTLYPKMRLSTLENRPKRVVQNNGHFLLKQI